MTKMRWSKGDFLEKSRKRYPIITKLKFMMGSELIVVITSRNESTVIEL